MESITLLQSITFKYTRDIIESIKKKTHYLTGSREVFNTLVKG